MQDAIADGGLKHAHLGGDARIKRDADRHRLPVRHLPCAHRLQSVRGPVAVIERPRRTLFEGIATTQDVFAMQLGAAANDRLCGSHVTRTNGWRGALELRKHGGVLQQRDLHRLAESTQPVLEWQRGEQALAADHGVRCAEGTQRVLLVEGVHARLHAHGAVILGKRGGGHAHQRHAAMGHACAEARRIQHRATADGDHAAAPAHALVKACARHALCMVQTILAGFAARHGVHGAQGQVWGGLLHHRVQALGQTGPGGRHAAVDEGHTVAFQTFKCLAPAGAIAVQGVGHPPHAVARGHGQVAAPDGRGHPASIERKGVLLRVSIAAPQDFRSACKSL